MLKHGDLFSANIRYMNQLVEKGPGPAVKEAPIVDGFDIPEYGFADKVAWNAGLALTFARVYAQLDAVDLTTQAAELNVPVYFTEGRYDINALTEVVERYFAVLQAPHKELVWFNSGHGANHTAATEWNEFMINQVLVAAQDASGRGLCATPCWPEHGNHDGAGGR